MPSRSRRRRSQRLPQSSGLSTDINNAPVVDPTENVLSLVEAAIRRQDDLRVAESRLHAVEMQHVKELAALRESHSSQLRNAEAERINAIRSIDVGAVNRAAEVASTQATTLATQVATVAETLRAQVAAAATASTTALAAALEPIQKDVSELRQVQFQQQGERVAQKDDRTTRQVSSSFILALFVAGVSLAGFVALLIRDFAR